MRDECAGETDEGAVVPGTEYADKPGEAVDCESCPEVVPEINNSLDAMDDVGVGVELTMRLRRSRHVQTSRP